MSTDELANRRQGIAAPKLFSSAGAAEDDRRLAAEDRRQAARYLSGAYRDDTTGALSRRPGREQMQLLLDRARREQGALTFLFLDVDGLKRVNDSQGHDHGDALLAAVGTALRSSLRSYDVVVRYGGDEFVCALPGGNGQVAEESLARVRSTLARLLPGASVSAGCAEMQAADTIDDAIRRADTDLYRRRGQQHASSPRALTGVSTPAQGEPQPSVACGMCGGRVRLDEFVLELNARMTRCADCPNCGATTVIQLDGASTRPPGPSDAPVDG